MPIFTSSIMENSDYNINFINRLSSLLKKTLNSWFKPNIDDEYRALKEVKCFNEVGNYSYLPMGAKVSIYDVTTQDIKNKIILEYSGKKYILSGIDYYWFNYWFKPTEKKEFYL
jgi:hypothetical protein